MLTRIGAQRHIRLVLTFGGMKFWMMKSLSFSCFVKFRMESSISFFSFINSCSKSSMSFFVCWYFDQIFFNFFVLEFTSSVRELYFSSRCNFSSSCSFIFLVRANSLSFFAMSSWLAIRRAASCLAALLAMSPPVISSAPSSAAAFEVQAVDFQCLS